MLRANGRWVKLSGRKLQNHEKVCWCLGLPFPHRMGSVASDEYGKRMGTQGCYYGVWLEMKKIEEKA